MMKTIKVSEAYNLRLLEQRKILLLLDGVRVTEILPVSGTNKYVVQTVLKNTVLFASSSLELYELK